jgi:hypothetical protein
MLLSSNLNAQTLKQFTFQGKLSDVNENFSGTKKIEYTIYDLNDILWRETHNNVTITNGNYELKLGSITAFPTNLFKTDVIERTVVIKVEDITQGFFRLPDFTQNNSVFNGKTLTVDFGKYGKQIDFDKIVVENYYQNYIGLCLALERKTPINDNYSTGLIYRYEELLSNYAKSNINTDGEELFINKINAYISKCSIQLICNSNFAKKEEIDLLKLGVATSDWEFLNNALRIYQFPLNEIGRSDKMTVLDFIYEDINFYKSTGRTGERLANLYKYYNLFKKEGARHHKYPSNTSIN